MTTPDPDPEPFKGITNPRNRLFREEYMQDLNDQDPGKPAVENAPEKEI